MVDPDRLHRVRDVVPCQTAQGPEGTGLDTELCLYRTECLVGPRRTGREAVEGSDQAAQCVSRIDAPAQEAETGQTQLIRVDREGDRGRTVAAGEPDVQADRVVQVDAPDLEPDRPVVRGAVAGTDHLDAEVVVGVGRHV